MIDYKLLTEPDADVSKKRGKKSIPYSNNIYTFDIETTSLFYVENKWQPFDYSKSNDYYAGVPKVGIPYIWMFGVNDVVYYGREFLDFEKVLKSISDPILRKIIWIHNASFEFGFLPDIFKNYTVVNMVSRGLRKPISFLIKELNIEFRCTYMLTNMSLEKAGKEFTDIEKLVGELDYNKARGTTTPLTDQELKYCEHDILVLYKIVLFYFHKYDDKICDIPLTSTSEVRKALNKQLDYWYHCKVWDLVPDVETYLQLVAIFAGGYTHSNIINTNRIILVVVSWDIASSYPAVLVTEKFAIKPFKMYTYDRYLQLKDTHCFYFKLTLRNIKSKYYMHYISFSKCFDVENVTTDNGRVAAADKLSIWCCDIDLEIIQKNYTCDIEFDEIYGSYKAYLDIRVIEFILDAYRGKTSLKGIPEQENMYRLKKSQNNCIYGISCTNALKNNSFYDNDTGWYAKDFTEEFVNEILTKQKKSYSNLFFYATGCWVTAYARRNVYLTALKLDRDVCYIDTDSIKYKYKSEYTKIFQEYNHNMVNKYKKTIEKYPKLKLDEFMPKDQDGIKRPIGFFENESYNHKTKQLEPYDEFITMGAKKYAYKINGEVHITISGVNKETGVAALKGDLHNFKKGLTFNYHESGKLTHYYNDEQPEIDFYDYMGNKQHSKQSHGVVLQPTTYVLGLTDYYEILINDYNRRDVLI